MINILTILKTVVVIYLVIGCMACTTSGKHHYTAGKKYVPESKDLYDTIAYMDSILFDAFNNRDLAKQKTIFATNLEFYHDKGGVTHYNEVIENTRTLFNQNNGLKRTLLPGTLEVYPIKDYGAIETGTHRFCHKENGKDDCGVFKFVHIWQKPLRDGN